MRIPRLVAEGWTSSIELASTLDGPPEVVWDLLTDWEKIGDWMLEASDFVVVSEMREGVGVEAESTVSIGGIKTRDRVRVIGWEPNQRLAIEHLGWVRGTGEFNLTPLRDGKTHVFWREDLQPPVGMLGAIGLSGFKPLMRGAFKRDLAVLGGLVRARSGAKPPPETLETPPRRGLPFSRHRH
jgi:uncharacterized protein YndB with AHSA1/START domain